MKKLLLILLVLFGFSNARAQYNTATGTNAGNGSVGSYNSLFGYETGNALSSSSLKNSAFGAQALYSNTSGVANDAFGAFSLYSNTTGGGSAAFGYASLYSNTSGAYNTAIGHQSLNKNTTGSYNVVVGQEGAVNNTTANDNTGIGYYSLYSNSTGTDNTAVGFEALYSATGGYNTAVGTLSLYYNTSGTYNTAIGSNSGPSSTYPNLTNTTCVGNGAYVVGSNYIEVGNSSVTAIGGFVGWNSPSDGRFKTNVKEDVSGLAFIKLLRPVSYNLDVNALEKFSGIPEAQQQKTSNSASIRRTGFIAQEVETATKTAGFPFSGLITPQNSNDHYRLVYGDFVVPLVKAVQELNAGMTSQRNKIDSLVAIINAFTSKGQVNQSSNNQSAFGGQAVLNQNFPNPFSVNTQITMALPETIQVATLMIYNMQGAQLKSISVVGRGNVSATISAGELTAGMYLYALIADGQLIDTKKMILTN